MSSKKDRAMKKRKELEQKIKFKIDDLSVEDRDNLKAIAIKYDKDSKQAPMIVASGKGRIAADILSIAEENEIPMMQDKKLSKLLSSIKINREIPAALFKIVAEVLAFIFYLEKMAKKRSLLRTKFRRIKK